MCDETEAHWCPQVIGEIFTAKLEVDGSMVYFKQKGIYYIGNGEPVIKGVEPESYLRESPWWNIWNVCERR